MRILHVNKFPYRRGGAESYLLGLVARQRVIYNFVGLAHIPAAPRAGSGFTFVGRLSHEKGVDVLIRALGLAPELTLVVAGEGPAKSELETLSEAVAPGRVRFVGQLAREDVLGLIRHSLASVLPARWHENQPMSILESFGSAVPAVVTSLGGLPELVSDGRTGCVVPPEDAPALAAALRRLAADPEATHAMGQAAREVAEESHAAPAHLRAVDQVYREIVDRTPIHVG